MYIYPWKTWVGDISNALVWAIWRFGEFHSKHVLLNIIVVGMTHGGTY